MRTHLMDLHIHDDIAGEALGFRITTGTFDAIGWLKGTICPVREVLATWSRSELAEVPAGRNWDVVRAAVPLGWDALSRMHRRGHLIGPTLLTAPAHALEILVPPGTADDWDAADTIAMGEGGTLRCPDPRIIAPRSIGGRSWLVPPDNSGRATDPEALYAALAAALPEALREGPAGHRSEA